VVVVLVVAFTFQVLKNKREGRELLSLGELGGLL
jgi:hypothetical protein